MPVKEYSKAECHNTNEYDDYPNEQVKTIRP